MNLRNGVFHVLGTSLDAIHTRRRVRGPLGPSHADRTLKARGVQHAPDLATLLPVACLVKECAVLYAARVVRRTGEQCR
jgi:hypothetical protein